MTAISRQRLQNFSPRIILVVASSIDGRITNGRKQGSDWTSVEDKIMLHKVLDGCDAVVCGRKTYTLASKPLSSRNCVVFTRTPKSFGILPTCGRPTRGLNDADVKKHVPFNGTASDFRYLAGRNNWKKLAILGGTEIYDYFFKNFVVHEIHLTIEPVIFGKGLTFTHSRLQNFIPMRIEKINRLNKLGTIAIKYVAK